MPRHTLLAALCLLAGCSVHDSHVALAAKSELIGTTQTDLDMCAGLPTKTEKISDRVELRSYEYKADTANAVTVNLPVIGGGVSLGSGGYCHATFKMVGGKVSEVRYAGDTNAGPGGTDALCSPIVAHCLQGAARTQQAAAQQTTAPGKP